MYILCINNYIYVQGRRQDIGSGEGETSHKISYMNSTQVLYCNGVAKISVRGTFSKKYSSKTFEKFWKIYKNLHKNLKNLHKNLKNFQIFSKLKLKKIEENLGQFNKNFFEEIFKKFSNFLGTQNVLNK